MSSHFKNSASASSPYARTSGPKMQYYPELPVRRKHENSSELSGLGEWLRDNVLHRIQRLFSGEKQES